MIISGYDHTYYILEYPYYLHFYRVCFSSILSLVDQYINLYFILKEKMLIMNCSNGSNVDFFVCFIVSGLSEFDCIICNSYKSEHANSYLCAIICLSHAICLNVHHYFFNYSLILCTLIITILKNTMLIIAVLIFYLYACVHVYIG